GKEVRAFVKNLAKDGAFYWVFATVTPSYDPQSGKILGYFSVRRAPERSKLSIIEPLYKMLLDEEKRGGVSRSAELIEKILKEKGVSYDEFINTL
ncbi:MAG: PAS sensor protein, partial [Hydrogenimonas sp.]|nr:PAS sensor protein [Hydrogenimonas sp.]